MFSKLSMYHVRFFPPRFPLVLSVPVAQRKRKKERSVMGEGEDRPQVAIEIIGGEANRKPVARAHTKVLHHSHFSGRSDAIARKVVNM